MIGQITIIFVFQLIGETLTHSFGLAVPGPVVGMALFLCFLAAVPKAAKAVEQTAQGILAHLSLLFVPAGVGIVGHFDQLGTNGFAILLSLAVSTALAIGVAAVVFERVNALMGKRE